MAFQKRQNTTVCTATIRNVFAVFLQNNWSHVGILLSADFFLFSFNEVPLPCPWNSQMQYGLGIKTWLRSSSDTWSATPSVSEIQAIQYKFRTTILAFPLREINVCRQTFFLWIRQWYMLGLNNLHIYVRRDSFHRHACPSGTLPSKNKVAFYMQVHRNLNPRS